MPTCSTATSRRSTAGARWWPMHAPRAEMLCALIDRLDAEQLATQVRCHLVDGGQVVLDGPMPWSTLLEIQAQRHVPGHTAQLRALRG